MASERLIGHDGAGNIVSDTRSGTAYGYTYNARNRLDTVSVAGVTQAAYTYNGLEQLAIRVNIAGGAATTHYLHDLAGNVIAETDGTGAAGTVREVVWLPETEISPTMGSRTQVDRPLAVVDGVDTTPVTWWVHVDHLNRPIKMTDAARASVWTAVWAPWGAPSSITGPATLDARFPGQWFQLEAGLHYNWHRHYDPTLGRYTQPDPLGFVDGPGVFEYARGKPLELTDLHGLSPDDSEIPSPPDGGTTKPQFPDDPNPSFTKQAICIAAHALVDLSCKIPFRKCFGWETCAQLRQKIVNRRNCLTARRIIRDQCYGPESGHDRAIESEEDGLQNCIRMSVEKGCGCPQQ